MQVHKHVNIKDMKKHITNISTYKQVRHEIFFSSNTVDRVTGRKREDERCCAAKLVVM